MRSVALRASFALVFAIATTSTAIVPSAAAIPLGAYRIVPLGLADAEHTSPSGLRDSFALPYRAPGYVVGTSYRYGSTAYPTGLSAWTYDIARGVTTRLGFTDAAHTSSTGVRESAPTHVVASGVVAGYSIRVSATSSFPDGRSAWLYDPASGSTTRIGLFDTAHTSLQGTQESFVRGLSGTGFASGTSARYAGGTSSTGTSAWLHDVRSAASTRIGYFDAEHTSPSGYQVSQTYFLFESGNVVGSSESYHGSGAAGSSLWLYDRASATTQRLGLIDVDHTRSDGVRSSQFRTVSDSGYIGGRSDRYVGGLLNPGTPFASPGGSAWLYDPTSATTTQIGFVDAAHTRADGLRESAPTWTNATGATIGYSQRFAGSADLGRSAWLYEPAGAITTRLGYFDARHTRADGYQLSEAGRVTASGLAIGYSELYGASTGVGRSGWLYDAGTGTTTPLGFTDAVHTGADGYQYTSPVRIAESGIVAGTSSRFDSGSALGISAWVYDHARSTTTRLGLFDERHVQDSDQLQRSVITSVTESGYVVGYSQRFDIPPSRPGEIIDARTAWIYDVSTATQASIVLDEESNGLAFSTVSFISEDGLAVGYYHEYLAGPTSSPVRRAFAWTRESGAVDLRALIVGDPSAADWIHLADVLGADDLGHIVGKGLYRPAGTLASIPFLLVPVPEPGTLPLVAGGLVGFAALRRRASRWTRVS